MDRLMDRLALIFSLILAAFSIFLLAALTWKLFADFNRDKCPPEPKRAEPLHLIIDLKQKPVGK
jgi:hypothetical protein